MEPDYGSEEGQSAPSEDFASKDRADFETAVDLDSHQSPPAKRVRRPSALGLLASSPSSEIEDDEEEDRESEDGGDDWDEESVNSFVLDIFHAKGTQEAGEESTLFAHSVGNIQGLPPRISEEESDALKAELHAIGSAPFMKKYLQGDSPYSIYDILSGFGYIVVCD